MKTFFSYVVLPIVFLLFGCEKELTDSDLPYVEKIVVRGFLQPGDIVDSLYVGRTLPSLKSNESYTVPYDTIATRNAVVIIYTDDKEFRLHYYRNGYFKNDSLIAVSGKTYRLHVEWNGKIAEAVTTVPENPIYDSIVISSIKTIPPSRTNYLTTYEYKFNEYCKTTNGDALSVIHEKILSFSSYQTDEQLLPGSKLKTTQQRTFATIIQLYDFEKNAKIVFKIRSYDEPYYRYYITFGSYSGDFGSNTSPVAWNVTNDGIGMFTSASQEVVRQIQLP